MGEATFLKITDKRDDFKRRNQLGYALIFVSVNKPVLNKINMSPYDCRNAFLILETTYGRNLTVAKMAFIKYLLETAENFICVALVYSLSFSNSLISFACWRVSFSVLLVIPACKLN